MAPWALLSPGVLVRTGHTVLTWGITLVLFLHDTGLCSARDRLSTFSYIPLHIASSCSPPAPASLSFSGLSSAAAVGRAGGAAPAPYLPAPRAGLPAALPGRVAHGPGLCECPAPAPGGGQGGADSHGSSSHPPSALQILPGAGLASISPSLGGYGCGPAGCSLPPSCCSPSSLWRPACSSPHTSTWWPATPPPGSSSPRTALPTSASAPATPLTAA
ncbi:palmitoyltransferase ZDHHC12 isoform X6 [Callorhinus ursinus]|uniref:palmitoyltransferase ZDHHC12 isoform X6 n=1 Tax=Callorhinus ursinus TaxID=34884 RepID=UPI003CCFFA90